MITSEKVRRTAEFLDGLGVRFMPHAGGRTLWDHLLGTLHILKQWGQSEDLCLAGMTHSLYSTDSYKYMALSRKSRHILASEIGTDAERLVHLFCEVDRTTLFREIEDRELTDAHEYLVQRHAGGSQIVLTPGEIASLVLIHMANLAEQARNRDGSPGLHLSKISSWGKKIRPMLRAAPQIFAGCVATLEPMDERSSRTLYLSGLARLYDAPKSAVNHLLAGVKMNPWVAEPEIALARAYILLRDWRSAANSALHALSLLNQWGTTWDKRLSYIQWKALAMRARTLSEYEFLGDHPKAAIDDQVKSGHREKA